MRRPGRRNRLLAWGAMATGLAATAVMLGTGGEPTAPPGTVVVAVRDLPAGVTIGARDLAVREVPAGWTAGGIVRTPADAAGRRTVAALAEGDLVTVAVTGGNAQVAPLSAGQRAVPVPASAAGGSAATLTPGSRVDVVASRGDGIVNTTAVVVWNAEVIAVPPPAVDGYADESAAVLLRATPGEALRITSALNFARDVRLVMRPAGEKSTRPPRSVVTP